MHTLCSKGLRTHHNLFRCTRQSLHHQPCSRCSRRTSPCTRLAHHYSKQAWCRHRHCPASVGPEIHTSDPESTCFGTLGSLLDRRIALQRRTQCTRGPCTTSPTRRPRGAHSPHRRSHILFRRKFCSHFYRPPLGRRSTLGVDHRNRAEHSPVDSLVHRKWRTHLHRRLAGRMYIRLHPEGRHKQARGTRRRYSIPSA